MIANYLKLRDEAEILAACIVGQISSYTSYKFVAHDNVSLQSSHTWPNALLAWYKEKLELLIKMLSMMILLYENIAYIVTIAYILPLQSLKNCLGY